MFVQVIEAKTKDAQALRTQMEAWDREIKPGAEGFLGSTAGVTEDGTFIAAARFETEEAARRNSERPEQGRWWEETAQHLEGEATFYDCRDVDVILGGGSDDAGFVQVIQGYANDKAKLREMGQEMEGEASRRRDFLGGFAAWGPDDGFSQFVYFTSEAEAREGEKNDEGINDEQFGPLIRDIKFLDLKDPWLSSP